MASLLRGFVRAAQLHCTRTALRLEGESFTYESLAALAGAIAAQVKANAPGEAPILGVYATHSLSAYAGALAAPGCARTLLALDPYDPPRRINAILAHSGVEALVVGAEAADRLDGLLEASGRPLLILTPELEDLRGLAARHRRHRFVDARALAQCNAELEAPAMPGRPAFLTYVGGAQRPRPLSLSHQGLVHYIDQVTRSLDLDPDDRVSQLFDLRLSQSLHDLFSTWQAGATLVALGRSERRQLGQRIRSHRLTRLAGWPALAAGLWRTGELGEGVFADLRSSIFFGAPLDADLAHAWQQAAPRSLITSMWGPPQAGPALATRPLNGRKDTTKKTSKTNTLQPDKRESNETDRLTLFDAHMAATITHELRANAPGEPGELVVSGPQVPCGKTPDSTRAPLVELDAAPPSVARAALPSRWLRTGHNARILEGGQIELGERLDDQIYLGGELVDLSEIDLALQQACGHRHVAVVPWPRDTAWPAGLIALVVAGADQPLDVQAILAACRRQLPAHLVPDRVLPVRELARRSCGAPDREAIARHLENERS